jgi:hypothetical protein
MGLATYQNAEWAQYFGANVAANLMAQARSMARPEPLVDKRPPTVVRNGELLDSNGQTIGRQNQGTGQWEYVARPTPPTPLGLPKPVAFTDEATGLNSFVAPTNYSHVEAKRLAYEYGGPDTKFRIGEGRRAAAYQEAFGKQLERVDPLDYAKGRKVPDYRVTDGPDAGKTIDFMFTPDTLYSVTNFNENFLKTPRDVTNMRYNIQRHLEADEVVINFGSLTIENQKLLTDKILNHLSPADREKILIAR